MQINNFNYTILKYNHKILNQQSFNAYEMVELGQALVCLDDRYQKIRDVFLNLNDASSFSHKITCYFEAKHYVAKVSDCQKVQRPSIAKMPLKLWSAQETNSPSAFSQWINTVLDIHLLPAPWYQDDYKQMSRLCETEFTPENIKNIRLQFEKVPLMFNCIIKIKESYSGWLSCADTNELNQLKHKIHIQQQNCMILSRIISTFEQEKGDLSFLTYDLGNDRVLAPFLRGEVLISDQEAAQLKNDLKNVINVEKVKTQLQSFLFDHAAPTYDRFRKYPIKKTIISKQAKLFQAIIRSLIGLNQQLQLNPLNTSRHSVYPLRDSNSSHSFVAFYKPSLNPMEKFVWDLAGKFGFSEYFTATNMIEMPRITKWVRNDRGYDIVQSPTTDSTSCGGIQALIEGITLDDYLYNPHLRKHEIPRINFVKATMALLIFGMGDAHTKNIFITSKGKIQFFDNGRTLHHSNGAILTIRQLDRSDPNSIQIVLLPTLRSSLLASDDSYSPLSVKERREIQRMLREFNSKIKHVKRYLDLEITKKELSGMSKLIFDQESWLAALQERIDLLSTAISNSRVTNLRDLTLYSQPNLLFYAALSLAATLDDAYVNRAESSLTKQDIHECQKIPLASLGYDDVGTLLDMCIERGLDPKRIQELCENEALTFDEIATRIIRMLKRNKFPEPETVRKEAADQILNEHTKMAKLDFKDIASETIQSFLTVELKEMAAQHEVIQYFDSNGLLFSSINEHVFLEKLAASKIPPLTPVAILVYDRYPLEVKIAFKTFEGAVELLDLELHDNQTVSFGDFDQINASQLDQLFAQAKKKSDGEQAVALL